MSVGSILSTVFRFLLTRLLPLSVVVLAIVVGWLQSTEVPIGTFFATIIPLTKGYLPSTIAGHGYDGPILSMQKLVPVLPDNARLLAKPRPANEMFIELVPNKGEIHKLPMNGIGMCCRPAAYDDVLVERTVLWYLLEGGRHIDTAMLYLNHVAIGKALKRAAEEYGIPRSDVFLTTKIPPSFFGYETTLKTVPPFLEELGVDYIDLVLMHFPSTVPVMFPKSKECKDLTNKQCRQETWKALSELRAKGMLRNIGVSNFGVHHLQEIEELRSEIGNDDVAGPIAANQIPFNPWSPQSWVDSYEYCQKQGIAVTAYNSLGGLFQNALASTVDTLQDIAARHENRTVAQVLLRWSIQKNAAVIPGTGNPAHMRENLSVYDFELSPEEMSAIDKLREDELAKKFFSMEPRED